MATAIDTTANNNKNRDASSPWPSIDAARIAFLLDARDDFEAELLRNWVEEHKPPADVCPSYSFVTLSKDGAEDCLAGAIEDSDRTWLQPLRIAWLPRAKDAANRSRLDFLYGRAAAAGKLGRRWLAKRQPERLAFVAGDGASLNELRERCSGSSAGPVTPDKLADFMTSQALIALERSERNVRGTRYKIPRILPGHVFANEEFQKSMAGVAEQHGSSVSEVLDKAAKYLKEMAAMQTPYTLDLMTSLYRTAVRSNHDAAIGVDEAQLADVAQTVATRPVVFLISHKSMLDTAALSLVLFDANLPLPLTFGGINLRTPGVGTLARRSGIIFLRRSFQDNDVYKFTFRRYIDYLIEKRFSLLWALEGTRSRTGKLLPPRFGLFNYVVESILRTKLYDVTFIPVSVAYDQITEVEDYAVEQRGKKKKPEGITWALRFLRRGKSRGKIHLRFGDSLTITDIVSKEQLDAGIDEEQKQVIVPTLAFEVAVRMNAATPITAIAIITLILLAGGNRAMTLGQIQRLALPGVALIRRRGLEIVGRADFDNPDAIRVSLEELHHTGIVKYFDEGIERLYAIGANQHHNAAYYRNTAIHYFILDAFVEIALLIAAADDDNPVETFFSTTESLRELFKFEFYLPRRAGYREEIEKVAADRFGDWQKLVAQDEPEVLASLREVRTLVAHVALRSFVDAYRIVAKVLASKGDAALEDEAAFVAECLRTGKQQLLQGRVFSAESVSKTLYATGLKLAAYRGLLAAYQAEPRRELHMQFRRIHGCLDQVLAISVALANAQDL